jgi:soluble lytic murein transglycosylase-like protein
MPRFSSANRYDPKAVSIDGAVGLMQLKRVTARHYGVGGWDALFDPQVYRTVGTATQGSAEKVSQHQPAAAYNRRGAIGNGADLPSRKSKIRGAG